MEVRSMNIYNYLFYKIYIFTKRLGNYEVAYSAMLGMSFLLILNVFQLMKIVGIPEKIYDQLKPFVLGISALIIMLNYFLFNHNGRYLKTVNYFRTESNLSRIAGNTIVFLYVVLTFGLIFIL
jgi:hypothetical protein